MTVLDALAAPFGRVLSRRSVAGDLLRRVRHRLAHDGPNRPIEAVIDAFGATHPRARFVQVGSNDGVRFDPICRQVRSRPWTGVMIEPIPYLFDRLVQNFGPSRRLKLMNVAVSDHAGTQPLYHLEEDASGALPAWYDALGSFRRDVLLSHRDVIPDIEDRVRVLEVPCLPFDEVCERAGLRGIDLVHIDTEGFDFEVVKLIDLPRWQPSMLLYEHLHLKPLDRTACEGHLRDHGFSLLSDGMDTLCVQPAVLATHPRLRVAWEAALAAHPGER